jgi:hypothetical protein
MFLELDLAKCKGFKADCALLLFYPVRNSHYVTPSQLLLSLMHVASEWNLKVFVTVRSCSKSFSHIYGNQMEILSPEYKV